MDDLRFTIAACNRSAILNLKSTIITIHPEICHGKPCIRDMRYPVVMNNHEIIVHECFL
ncbi:MAG: DUF433 domain-containing protein [Bacteroidales bacterium]|nr:DUF433 domain-containing protein [Bacteroidales bacterium]